MFENIMNFFKKMVKKEQQTSNSKDAAKERLHLVLMQDRANVSADFLDLMKQEIIEVIKKYIEVDESAIDVRLTNKENEDGTNGAPALYANIPIVNIKDETRKQSKTNTIKKDIEKQYEEDVKEEVKEQDIKNTDKKSSKNEHQVENEIKEQEKDDKIEDKPKESTKSEQSNIESEKSEQNKAIDELQTEEKAVKINESKDVKC